MRTLAPVPPLHDARRAGSAAVTASGALYTWGFNNWGEAGVGTRACLQTPQRVMAFAEYSTQVLVVAAGGRHTVRGITLRCCDVLRCGACVALHCGAAQSAALRHVVLRYVALWCIELRWSRTLRAAPPLTPSPHRSTTIPLASPPARRSPPTPNGRERRWR
jgi:Regulator of chromosome condensation (RCC1) repeat